MAGKEILYKMWISTCTFFLNASLFQPVNTPTRMTWSILLWTTSHSHNECLFWMQCKQSWQRQHARSKHPGVDANEHCCHHTRCPTQAWLHCSPEPTTANSAWSFYKTQLQPWLERYKLTVVTMRSTSWFCNHLMEPSESASCCTHITCMRAALILFVRPRGTPYIHNASPHPSNSEPQWGKPPY